MLDRLKELFQPEQFQNQRAALGEADRRLACAALLIEVAVIDNEFDGTELAELKTILVKQFDIPSDEIDALVTMAQAESADSTSMYQFTQAINRHFSPEEKFELVTGMWRIAYADGDLDKYEEYIVRKVSDLIHLPHGDFIRAKHAARTE